MLTLGSVVPMAPHRPHPAVPPPLMFFSPALLAPHNIENFPSRRSVRPRRLARRAGPGIKSSQPPHCGKKEATAVEDGQDSSTHTQAHTHTHNMSSLIKSAKSILPTLDRVLVQRIKVPQKTSSGIYIPEKNAPKNNLATVIAVGPGFTSQNGELIKPSVQAGDKVLLPPHGGSPINIEKEEYLLMRDSEILAKVQE